MLSIYHPTRYNHHNLANYNIRYYSSTAGTINAIFIARYYDDTIFDIETFAINPSPTTSRDLIKFYDLIIGLNPAKIKFQQDGSEYNYNLMLKLADKYNYEVYNLGGNKYELIRVD